MSLSLLCLLSITALNCVNAQLTKAEKDELLNGHNEYRSQVNPTAANMLKMEWNDTLALLAQEWADKCNFAHPSRSNTKYAGLGQNIALDTAAFDAAKQVRLWKSEVEFYTFSTNTCRAGQQCGHYTQVVWANSFKLGCGKKKCATVTNASLRDAFITVCQYGPAGNYIGEKPYQMGNSCTKCPTSHPICNNKLCSNGGSKSAPQGFALVLLFALSLGLNWNAVLQL